MNRQRVPTGGSVRGDGVHRIGRIRSIGVEEELLLVDSDDLCAVPIAAEVMREAGGLSPDLAATLELEVKREQIEVVSPPLTTFEELSRSSELARSRWPHRSSRASRTWCRRLAMSTCTSGSP
jgi:gamma-glutamyl:cysteine ligase YbdK (ATP-grasp superfamily)